MKAFAIDAIGETGSVKELPEPEPGPGEVRIRVGAAGVNPFDNAVVQGYLQGRMEYRFPLIPGMDAAGTVEAVGEGVDGFSEGDAVFGSVGKRHLGEGTFAEQATMSTETLARTPEGIAPNDAAAAPVAGVSGLVMADALGEVEGKTVVVIGATGGVGSYLVQLLKLRGAKVVAISSGANAEVARSLGADDVIDHTAGDVNDQVRSRYPGGIDALADTHGDKDQVAALAELVREGGRVTSATGSADVDALAGRDIEASNIYGKVTTAQLERLGEHLRAGEVRTPELHTYTLEESGDALTAVSSGHTRGKIVVTVG